MKILIAFMIIALIGVASACSCMQPPAPLEELEAVDAVFSGKVIQIDPSFNSNYVTFEVQKSWKGPQKIKLAVETAQNSAACGYNFEMGKEYLVYAYGLEQNLTTGLCSRTAELSYAADDIAALGTPVVISENVERRTEATGQDYVLFYLPIFMLIAFLVFVYFKFKR